MGTYGNHLGFKSTLVASSGILSLWFWGLLVAAPTMDEGVRREQLHHIRLRQIPLLEQFLTKYSQSPKAAESLFRLGEAYFETSKYFEAKGQVEDSKQNLAKARSTLEKLQNDYPNFEHKDEVLFILANSYIEMKEMDKAGELLLEVASRYPNSPIMSEAALLLGDHFFTKNDFSQSEKYYGMATPEGPMQAYVFYKLAWSKMNLGKPSEALSYFEKVIALKPKNEEAGGDYSREAAREMMFAALEVYGSKQVAPYLKRTLKEPELLKISLNTLAKGLVQRSQFDKAGEIYAVLQEEFPNDAEKADWISSELRMEENLGRSEKLKPLLAKLHGVEGADKVMAQIFNTAKKFHAEAKKASEGPEKVRLWNSAIGYYRTLSELEMPEAIGAEVYFYYAEALYSQNSYSQAAAYYERSAKISTPLQAKALWSWFLTAEKMADGFQYKGKERRELSRNDLEYVRASEFIQTSSVMTDEQKRRAQYQSARLIYQLNDLEKALPLFQTIADQTPQTSEGKLSAQLVLDIFNLKKDYKQLAQYARKAKGNADASQKSELNQLEQQAELKSIQAAEQNAKGISDKPARLVALEGVAKDYDRFSSSYPNSRFVDGALWAAIQNYAYVLAEGNADMWASLHNAFFSLTQNYSGSKYAQSAIQLMGRILAFRKNSPEELSTYARFHSHWKKQWMSEASDIRGAMGMLVYRMTSSDSERRSLAQQFSKLPRTTDNREAFATSEYWRIKDIKNKFESVALTSLKTLKSNTKKKMELLDKIHQEITQLVKLQVPVPAIEGLRLLGEAYLEMGLAMRKAPIPKQLEGENLAKYREIVEGSAQEMEAKGREAERLASEKAKEFGLS